MLRAVADCVRMVCCAELQFEPTCTVRLTKPYRLTHGRSGRSLWTSGALNNRLMLWYLEQQDAPADDSMLTKMLNEPRIPLILLKSYKHLHD